MSKVFVITGPSGVGKGTLIRGLLAALPDLELSISATTRQPREGEEDGVDYHFLTPEEFERRIERERLPRVRHLQRQPLRDAALRGRAAARGRALGGARDRGPGRPAGARGEAGLDPDLHRPARPGGPARAPRRRAAPTPPRRSTSASRRPKSSWPRRGTSTTSSSTTISSRAAERAGGDRARRAPAYHLDSRADDQTPRRQASRAR